MNSNIPKDPVENLKRMQSIMGHWEDSMTRLLADRDRKTAATSEAEGFHQVVLMEGVNSLNDRIRELEGKMNDLSHKIEMCQDYIEEQKDLTYKPFENLQTAEETAETSDGTWERLNS